MLQRDSFFARTPQQKTPDVVDKVAAAAVNPVTAAAVRPAATGTPTAIEEARKAPKPAAPGKEGEAGSQLIVGPNIKLKGVEITDCDTLIVEGHIEATIDSRMIQISQIGTFSGTAGIDIAEIHGGFTGELTVRKCLTIHATGQVSGKIRYGKLVIEEGGEISGDIKRISDDERSLHVQHLATAVRPGAVPVIN
ncbi:MAG: polymer-forming cytoskeletal protein [Burkholderiales bacterium]